jgi:hypothetical protein
MGCSLGYAGHAGRLKNFNLSIEFLQPVRKPVYQHLYTCGVPSHKESGQRPAERTASGPVQRARTASRG